MNLPADLKYGKTHEWVQDLSGGTVRIGLTDHAQSELGDLVFVNLPEVGDEVVKGESFADVESVKAVSDVYSPVTGVVAAVNDMLLDTPETINANCYEAWLVEIKDVSDSEALMSASEYEAMLAKGE